LKSGGVANRYLLCAGDVHGENRILEKQTRSGRMVTPDRACGLNRKGASGTASGTLLRLREFNLAAAGLSPAAFPISGIGLGVKENVGYS
jgi:hypothetical protein